jgi:hypothetical protein
LVIQTRRRRPNAGWSAAIRPSIAGDFLFSGQTNDAKLLVLTTGGTIDGVSFEAMLEYDPPRAAAGTDFGALLGAESADSVEAATPKKIVFLAGKPIHGYGAHEYRAGSMLLAGQLNKHLGEPRRSRADGSCSGRSSQTAL